jgi:hypothetical protein
VDENAVTRDELEEQAEESGYGAAEGDSDEAPEQVLPADVTDERRDEESPEPDTPRA